MHLVKSKPPAGAAPSPTGGITTEQLTNMHRPTDPMVKQLESMGMPTEAAEQQAARMREMMSSPEWQAQFEALAQNPDAMRAMIEADPRAREMLNQVPEMRAVFNDPQELQRMARVMANPVSNQSLSALFANSIMGAAAGQGYLLFLSTAIQFSSTVLRRAGNYLASFNTLWKLFIMFTLFVSHFN